MTSIPKIVSWYVLIKILCIGILIGMGLVISVEWALS